MTRGIFGDQARYRATYWERFPGTDFAGDGARVDEDGDFWLLGRVDDVMNVSGHRISTIEVESALVDHQRVAEAAVCGRADATTGQAIVAYVTLKGGEEGSVERLEELRNHVAVKIGAIAKPANVVFTPELPKTRSGRSCAGSCATLRRTGRWAIRRRWRTRRSSRRSPTVRSPSRQRHVRGRIRVHDASADRSRGCAPGCLRCRRALGDRLETRMSDAVRLVPGRERADVELAVTLRDPAELEPRDVDDERRARNAELHHRDRATAHRRSLSRPARRAARRRGRDRSRARSGSARESRGASAARIDSTIPW